MTLMNKLMLKQLARRRWLLLVLIDTSYYVHSVESCSSRGQRRESLSRRRRTDGGGGMRRRKLLAFLLYFILKISENKHLFITLISPYLMCPSPLPSLQTYACTQSNPTNEAHRPCTALCVLHRQRRCHCSRPRSQFSASTLGE